MNPLQVVLLVSIIVGIAFIIFSLIISKSSEGSSTNHLDEATNTIKAIDRSIAEIDNTMEEFNKMSNEVFTQLDEKYKELLFLYSLIDEKKNEIASIYNTPQIISNVANQSQKPNKNYSNPKLAEIQELINKGQSVADVAKTLGMGQGEVNLILQLGKAR